MKTVVAIAMAFSATLAYRALKTTLTQQAIDSFKYLIAKNILLATNALKLFGQKQYETRISKTRADEFGALFNAFNTMGDGLKKSLDQADISDDQTTDLPTTPLENLDVSGIVSSTVDDVNIVQIPNHDKN